MFVVPKRGEVLRIGGTAQIVRDPDLLSRMAVNRRLPTLAILLQVEEAMFHCGKSMIRSGMWRPETWGPIEGLPSYAQALIDHGHPPHSLEEMEDRVARNETERLYGSAGWARELKQGIWPTSGSDEKAQAEKFRRVARELGCDEDLEAIQARGAGSWPKALPAPKTKAKRRRDKPADR